MRPPFRQLRGVVETLEIESDALATNPWGDPAMRSLRIYLPPGASRPNLPVVWYLAAYTNSGAAVENWRNFSESIVQRIDRLIADGALPPFVLAAPDAFSSLGGNQYVDSPGIGKYTSFLVEEAIPALDHAYPNAGSSARMAIGKSSGGFGALHLALEFPGLFAGIAAHSADMAFDVSLQPDFADVAERLVAYPSPRDFVDAFWEREQVLGADIYTLMFCCLAASYDPDPVDPTLLRMPFDLQTLETDPVRWRNWLRFDPVKRIQTQGEALKALSSLYIDVGTRDEYRLQYGARQLHRLLEKHGVAHHYEEHDGTHGNLDPRFERSLSRLLTGVA